MGQSRRAQRERSVAWKCPATTNYLLFLFFFAVTAGRPGRIPQPSLGFSPSVVLDGADDELLPRVRTAGCYA